jgi:hypothetical protein
MILRHLRRFLRGLWSRRQIRVESETPAAVCRAGWVWVREYVQDLRDDCANRVGTP